MVTFKPTFQSTEFVSIVMALLKAGANPELGNPYVDPILAPNPVSCVLHISCVFRVSFVSAVFLVSVSA
jgi:hypothetical protein